MNKSIKVSEKNKKNSMVFDTNIFLTGFDFSVIKNHIYTIQEVLEEIEVDRYIDKNRNIIERIKCAIASNQLIIKTPNEKYIKKIKSIALKTNILRSLSDVDLKLIALTLEIKEIIDSKVIIYTNDYTMENLCMELGLSFSSLIKEGIKKKKIFEIFCPLCRNVMNSKELICEICGSKLERREKKN